MPQHAMRLLLINPSNPLAGAACLFPMASRHNAIHVGNRECLTGRT